MDNKQFKTFLKYFVPTAAILILMVFLFWKNEYPRAFLTEFFNIVRPLILGGALAFVLNKPLNRIQSFFMWLDKKLRRKPPDPKKKKRTYYGVSVLTVYILFLALVVGIILFIVPQLVDSVRLFADSFETYYQNFNKLVDTLVSQYDLSWLERFNILDTLYEWVSGLTSSIPDILTATFGFTKNIIVGVADIFIGFIFSIYVLTGKTKLKAQTRKLFRALLSDKNYARVGEAYSLTSNTFSLFINGQLTDAFVLGFLCMIGMNILGFEYVTLISVIIGLTNLIPIFGPIIGTVPCALILLFVNPVHAVWFVVFIIVLQQIDSNLIYPRIVGNSVGLSPVWTLLAITLGGGLFGIMGMILAVPTMSLIYVLISRLVNKRLLKKKAARMARQTFSGVSEAPGTDES